MSLPDRLRSDMVAAMKAGDRVRVSTLRSLIGAIENAGAIEVEAGPYEMKTGLGHDVPRREVTDDEIRRIISDEREDLIAAQAELSGKGQTERMEELATRAAIVAGYLE